MLPVRVFVPFLAFLAFHVAVAAADSEPAARRDVDYLRDIKPILTGHCGQCHGALRQKANLRLDAGVLILKGGDSGEVVEPGDSDASLLLEYILPDGDDPPQMPPEGQGTPLDEKQIALIKAWINAGAKVPQDEEIPADPRKHWSFQPIQRPAIPQTEGKPVDGNPIDAFIQAKHAEHELTARPRARNEILLRRVYLDLIGLPPTREELHQFLADDSPDAYEKVVDRLLESPHYGERWGRHWMDVWRYSDWAGYRAEVRESQPHIWRWRDWIIESLNNDKPYDRMLHEMLAGDELAPGDPDTLRATGFLVRNWYKFNRNVWLEATIEHTSKAFLGITMNCAKCHEHMYDPISQEEYYRFRAIFEPHQIRTDQVPGVLNTKKDGVVRAFDRDLKTATFLLLRGNEKHPVKENPLTPTAPASLSPVNFEIEPVKLSPQEFYPGLREHVQQDHLNYARAALQKSQAALKKLTDQQAAAKPEAESDDKPSPELRDAELNVAAKLVAYNLLQLQSVRARILADLTRYADNRAENVETATLSAAKIEQQAKLAKLEWEYAKADLAVHKARAAEKPDDKKSQAATKKAQDALTKAEKALTAAREKSQEPAGDYSPFGKVYPAESSGRRLALARWITHRDNPLAARVAVNHIWLRHFGEPLVPTVFDFGRNGKSPTHPELLDWLATELVAGGWKMKRLHRLMVTSLTYRMSSMTGDNEQNLAADPDNVYLWRMNSRRLEAEAVRDALLHVCGNLDLTAGGPEIDQAAGQTNFRRSVYFRSAKEKQMLFLELFDQANVNECYRRDESVVPQQALAMINSPLSLSQGRLLASQITKAVGNKPSPDTNELFLTIAFERTLCRQPTDEERTTCRQFLKQQTQLLADSNQLTKFVSGPEVQTKPAEDPAQRARENLVQVLLNHNDFFTIR